MANDKTILRKILAAEDHPSADAKYVRAVRKSSLARWFELCAMKPADKMPVPKVGAIEERLICELVDELREAKIAKMDAGAIQDIGEEIEWRVSELYGLTYEEELIVADAFHRGGVSKRERDARAVKWIKSDMTGRYVSRDEVMETLRNPSGD